MPDIVLPTTGSYPLPGPPTLSARLRKPLEVGFYAICLAGALALLALLILLALVLVFGALPAITAFGFGFLTGSDWNPSPEMQNFGALPFIYGTFVSSLLALLMALPVSIGAALFLTRLAPRWLVGPASFLIELLAAIPSIVYGFWGIAVLIPFMQTTFQPCLKSVLGGVPGIGYLFDGPSSIGFNMLSASIVLAIMITPIITAVSRDVLLSVPREIEEGAYALGATWWQASKEVLNFGKIGIMGAVILGLARAIGETMAVTMVIGNTNDINVSLFAPAQTMASLLANEFREANTPMHLHSLVYVALVLLILTVGLNILARMMVNRVRNSMVGAAARKRPAMSAADLTQVVKLSDLKYPPPIPRIKIKHTNPLVRIKNQIFRWLCISSATVTIVMLALIFGYVLYKGVSSVNLDFFTQVPGAPPKTGKAELLVGSLAPASQKLASVVVSAGDKIPLNSKLVFTALARDEKGAALDRQPALTWAVNDGGSIDSNGVFTGTKVGGPYTVTATAGDIKGSETVAVGKADLKPPAGPILSTIELAAPGAVALNGKVALHAVGLDSDGRPVSPQPQFKWAADGGGYVNSQGEFTATQAGGPYLVRVENVTHTGMANAIIGTLILVGLASLLGIPLGMLCGIYLAEYAKGGRFNDALRTVVDVLAGTPSIIVGVLAYELVVAKSGQFPSLAMGFSGIAGALALAVLMCPIIARTTEEMLRLVPDRYREASLALGSCKFHSILFVVVPAARSGIITGIMLSVARVAGETAPLLFTAVGTDSLVWDPRQQFPALTLQIFNYAQSPEADWNRQAWAGMLVLITIVTLLSAAMRIVARDRSGAVRGA